VNREQPRRSAQRADYHRVLGKHLRALREARGISGLDMAEWFGMSTAWVSKIENGQRGPSPTSLGHYCDALEIGILDLLAQVGVNYRLTGIRSALRSLRKRRGGWTALPCTRAFQAYGHSMIRPTWYYRERSTGHPSRASTCRTTRCGGFGKRRRKSSRRSGWPLWNSRPSAALSGGGRLPLGKVATRASFGPTSDTSSGLGSRRHAGVDLPSCGGLRCGVDVGGRGHLRLVELTASILVVRHADAGSPSLASVATTDTNGRFDSTSAVAVLTSACTMAGLESEDAELLRLGENAIFRLRGSACVVRIGRNMSHWADATKEVAVSAWLTAHEYPAAEALELPQPLEVGGHPLTFWKHINGRNGARQDIGVLAELLRELHSLKAPEDFQLPERDVLDRVRPRIEWSQVPAADKRLLVETCERLESELAAVDFPLSPAPTHGDAHVQTS
jgi:transcriptional regulator with XRE-family HTH domain